MATQQATLWIKTIRSKDGSKQFPKTLIKVLDNTFECVIAKDLMKKLNKMGLSFPLNATFNEDQYFIKTERVVREDGTVFHKQKVVLCDIESVEETAFEKYTFEDAIRDRENKYQ